MPAQRTIARVVAAVVLAALVAAVVACCILDVDVRAPQAPAPVTDALPAIPEPIPTPEPLPPYRPVEKVRGTLRSVGSDVMNNLMTYAWERFRKHHPEARIAIEGKGSSTAPPALEGGVADLGPMARPMKPSEIESFERRHGFRPSVVEVAEDMVAVFVHRENPVAGLTLDQLDAVYSVERRRGRDRAIETWGDAGLGGEWAERRIVPHGRNAASATYGLFRTVVLRGGTFRDEVREHPGNSAVVLAASEDRLALGYSGIGYATPLVRAVPLAEGPGRPFVDPATVGEDRRGEYPLSRTLYIYFAQAPGTDMDPLKREFLRFLLGRDGQEVVMMDGLLALSARRCREQLAAAGIR